MYRITDTGVDQAEIIDGVAAESTIVRLASSAAVNDAKFVVDAGSALTDTSLTMPGITTGTVLFGNGYDGLITRAMILPQTSTSNSGVGIYFWVEDVDGNGWKDIVAPGKEGLYLFKNLGTRRLAGKNSTRRSAAL